MLSGGPRTRSVEFLIRAFTSAVIAMGIVGAVIYQSVAGEHVNPELLGWGGIVVGAYIAQHATLNGKSMGIVQGQKNMLVDAAEQAMTHEAEKHEAEKEGAKK